MYDISCDTFRFIETDAAVIVQEVHMNKPVGKVTPPAVRRSKFSFSAKKAQELGDSMLDHYAELAQKISKSK